VQNSIDHEQPSCPCRHWAVVEEKLVDICSLQPLSLLLNVAAYDQALWPAYDLLRCESRIVCACMCGEDDSDY
jgi:hypothetical protein